MAAPRKYPDELRERATRMAVELRQDPETKHGAINPCVRATRDAPRDVAQLGPAGRGRRRCPCGHHDQRGAAVGRARAGEPRVASGQPHSEDGFGFLRGGARPPHQQVVAYIEAHRHDVVDGREVGVEPICAVLKKAGLTIAPSRYTRNPQATPPSGISPAPRSVPRAPA